MKVDIDSTPLHPSLFFLEHSFQLVEVNHVYNVD